MVDGGWWAETSDNYGLGSLTVQVPTLFTLSFPVTTLGTFIHDVVREGSIGRCWYW